MVKPFAKHSKIQWWQYAFGLILFVAVALRFWRLDFPSELYFDEVYHVPAIQLLSHGDWQAFEWWHPPVDGTNYFDWLHPPLAKYFQAGSVWLGREIFASQTAFWWRLPSALAGVGIVWIVFHFTNEVAQHWLSQTTAKLAALIAALLVATDGLLLVQSRIGMNDSLVALLILIAVWIFVRSQQAINLQAGWSWWFGAIIGLAIATKWSAVFIWFLAMIWQGVGEIITHTKTNDVSRRHLNSLPFRWFGYVVVPIFVYALLFLPAAVSHDGYDYVLELHRQIWLYQTHRDAIHSYASLPIEWFLNLRPVWYWWDAELAIRSSISLQPQSARIYALSHPLLPFLGIAALIGLSGGFFSQIKKQFDEKNQHNWRVFWLFSTYFAAWFPWVFSPRIMFYYHYTPAVPLLAVLIGLWLAPLVIKKPWIGIVLLTSWLLIGGLWLPQWLGLRVSQTMSDRIYFAMPTWR